MTDDPRPLGRDVALVARRGEHGRSAGDRLPQGDLPEVVEERRVLDVAQLAVRHPEHAAHAHAELGDPLRVAAGVYPPFSVRCDSVAIVCRYVTRLWAYRSTAT